MRVAAAVFKRGDSGSCIRKYEEVLRECEEKAVDLVVFPALTGEVCDFEEDFIEKIRDFSLRYKDIAINPGSYFENHDGKVYHSSFVMLNGEIKLFQRQLYLARWERELGLSRDTALKIADIKGYKISIILSTDVFYPQVSRYAALKGVNLVLSPVAIKGQRNFARQIAGVWQNVQQNLFFAIESGFKGEYKGNNFYSEAAIHAPLEMTKDDDGFLAKEVDSNIIIAELNEAERQKAISKFDVIKQLNINSYKGIFR